MCSIFRSPDPSPLMQFLIKENLETASNPNNFISMNPQPLFEDIQIERQKLLDCCKQLPTEWTVIQLCKRLNPKQVFSTYAENAKENVPLSVTILRHPIEPSEPINIEIECDTNFYELAYNVTNSIDEVLCSKTQLVTLPELCKVMLPVNVAFLC